MKMLSININGLNSIGKKTMLSNYILKNRFTIIAIQETKLSKIEDYKELDDKLENKYVFVYSLARSSSSTGVWLGFNKLEIDPDNIHTTYADNEGRMVYADVYMENNLFRIINVYAHNDSASRIMFFNSIKDVIEKVPYNIIICGDFNIVSDLNIDVLNIKEYRKRRDNSEMIFRNIALKHGMVDAYRFYWPSVKMTSFRRSGIGSRIDKIYVSYSIIKNVKECQYYPCVFSDHAFLICKMEVDKDKDKEVYNYDNWVINNKYLKDNNFKQLVDDAIIEVGCHSNLSDGEKWEMLKYIIKINAIKYSRGMARKNRNEISEIKCKINIMLREARNKNMNIENNNQYNEIVKRWKGLELERIKGAQMRARIKKANPYYKQTCAFYQIERNYALSKGITKLITDRGNQITDSDEIMKYVFKHFENAHKEFKSKIEYFNEFMEYVPKVKNTDTQGHFTHDEIFNAIKNASSRSSPGPDGISYNFMKMYYDKFKDIFRNMMIEISNKKLLSDSQTLANVILFPKANKDRTNINNYRPISCLNVDYKIIAKCLVDRINSFASEIIFPYQLAGTRGKNIADNVHLVRTLMDNARGKRNKFILISLDYKNAFNSISHEYIVKIIDHMIKDSFLNGWLKILYNSIYARIKLNSGFTSVYKIKRGIRQGCPLSMLLFAIALSPLMWKIDGDKGLKGINFAKGEIKCIAFADDLIIILKDPKHYTYLKYILNKFTLLTGLEINYDKSHSALIGNWEQQKVNLPNVNNREFIVHGCTLFMKQREYTMFWNSRFKELNKVMGQWRFCDLNFFDRAHLFNSKLISRIKYILKLTPIPLNVIYIINRLGTKFVLKANKTYIRRNMVYSGINKGGLGLRNLLYEMYTSRINFLLTMDKSVYNFVFEEYYPKSLGSPIVDMIMHGNSRFAKQLLQVLLYLPDNMKIEEWSNKTYKNIYNEINEFYSGDDIYLNKIGLKIKNMKKIVKIQIPPKMKNHLWQLIMQFLPVRKWLADRGIIKDNEKFCFCGEIETIEHLYFKCRKAEDLWRYATNRNNWNMNIINNMGMLYETLDIMKKDDVERLSVCVYTIWIYRCIIVENPHIDIIELFHSFSDKIKEVNVYKCK
jgi:exonuclease III